MLSGTVRGPVLVRAGAGGWRYEAPGPLRIALRLPPGSTKVALRTPVGDPSASLFAPTVTDSAFAPFERAATTTVRTGIIGPPCASVTA